VLDVAQLAVTSGYHTTTLGCSTFLEEMTVVERRSRLARLVYLPDGHTARRYRRAIELAIDVLPVARTPAV